MIYKVLNIEEDLDFGCEERAEGSEVMAVVTLQDKNQKVIKKKIADQYLYEKDINEQDDVFFNEKGLLEKR